MIVQAERNWGFPVVQRDHFRGSIDRVIRVSLILAVSNETL